MMPGGTSGKVGSWASPSAAAGCFASRGDQCMVFARNNGKYIVGMGCGYVKFLVKKISLLGGNIFYLSKNGTPPPFVKTFGMTSGNSVRGTVGLTLVRKYFNFYNIYIGWPN